MDDCPHCGEGIENTDAAKKAVEGCERTIEMLGDDQELCKEILKKADDNGGICAQDEK